MEQQRRTRREVIAGIGALAAAATAMPASAAEQSSASAGPFLVREGEGRDAEQWVIQGHDPIAAKIAGKDVAGRYAVIELQTPPGRGPALHIHPAQNEWFYVLRGSIGLQCGDQKVVLKAGDSFEAPMKVPHAYVTLGSEPARMLNIFDPAGQIEAFFAEYVRILNTPGRPDIAALNAASEQHGMKVVGPNLHASEFADA
jgi:quercetin dioxygenase-like cupin family protein